jgi:hypothetical protein
VPNLLRNVVSFLLVGLLVAFWTATILNGDLRRRWSALNDVSKRPFVLNGLTLQLEGSVVPSLDRRENAHTKYLVLVSSDECSVCQEQVDDWVDLMGRLQLSGDSEVVHITTNGTVLPERVRLVADRRGIPYRVLQVTNQAQFVEETGLAWTPALLLLDADLSVRLVTTQLSSSAVTAIEGFLQGNAE